MGLPQFTNLDEYYGDVQQYGDYQYNSLRNLVNNFMYSIQNDDIIEGVDVNRVVFHAKRGIQEFYFDVMNEIIRLEIELNPSLQIALPHDYISFVRVSWVDLQGKLHPLAVDDSLNFAQAYLQDNKYNFLYSNTGDILKGTHIQNRVGGSQPYGYDAQIDYSQDASPSYVVPHYGGGGGTANVNRARIYKNGSFTVDREFGKMQFSSNVDGRIIVLEYVSDGLYQRTDEQIKVHKFAEEALYAYIYWMLIKRRRNVPQNEKQAARKDFYNERRIAKRRIKPIRVDDIRQVLNGSGRNIKD
jgi:hypothetical protein